MGRHLSWQKQDFLVNFLVFICTYASLCGQNLFILSEFGEFVPLFLYSSCQNHKSALTQSINFLYLDTFAQHHLDDTDDDSLDSDPSESVSSKSLAHNQSSQTMKMELILVIFFLRSWLHFLIIINSRFGL